MAEGGKIVEGTFDGQLMIGLDGRQYPVPANYASKSKLVEGDMLKLVITDDGSFIYKQIGPFKRKRLFGFLRENSEEGGYLIEAEGRKYKVLLAAVTYHHAEPGDEIALVVADTDEARWAAIENVTKKGDGSKAPDSRPPVLRGEENEDVPRVKKKRESKKMEKEGDGEAKADAQADQGKESGLDEELTPDLEEMEKELKKQVAP